jgi:hypothetical protein
VIQVLDDKKLRVEGSDWALFGFRLGQCQRSSHRRREHEESDRGFFFKQMLKKSDVLILFDFFPLSLRVNLSLEGKKSLISALT